MASVCDGGGEGQAMKRQVDSRTLCGQLPAAADHADFESRICAHTSRERGVCARPHVTSRGGLSARVSALAVKPVAAAASHGPLQCEPQLHQITTVCDPPGLQSRSSVVLFHFFEITLNVCWHSSEVGAALRQGSTKAGAVEQTFKQGRALRRGKLQLYFRGGRFPNFSRHPWGGFV